MKILFIALLTLGTATAYSQTISEFERGYRVGIKSCENSSNHQETWSCTIVYTTADYNPIGVGNTKSEAINNAIKGCFVINKVHYNAVQCQSYATDEHLHCIKL